VPVHVWEVEVQEYDVVVIELAKLGALLAQVGDVDVKALSVEHHLDALRGSAVVLDEQDSHADSLRPEPINRWRDGNRHRLTDANRRLPEVPSRSRRTRVGATNVPFAARRKLWVLADGLEAQHHLAFAAFRTFGRELVAVDRTLA
jgi:hypothetical protein